MDADIAIDEQRSIAPKRFTFGISNLLMLIAMVAICIAWWGDRHPEPPAEYDVQGPISVSYSVRTSPNSTLGYEHKGVKGINLTGDNVVLYMADGGIILTGSSLIEFRWTPE